MSDRPLAADAERSWGIKTMNDCFRIRARMGLNQVKFARLIGASQQMVSRWEHDHNDPTGPAKRFMELIERRQDLVTELEDLAKLHEEDDYA